MYWANSFHPAVLKSLQLKNFTVFAEEHLHFGKNVNVIVGENGTGKTHLLKAIYAGLAQSHDHLSEKKKNPRYDGFFDISGRLNAMMGSETAYSLVHRNRNQSLLCESDSLEMKYRFTDSSFDFSVEIDPTQDQITNNSIGIVSDDSPSFSASTKPPFTTKPIEFVTNPPVFLPTRELLSIYPSFLALYDTSYVPFEASWRDACRLLGKPYSKALATPELESIKKQIEDVMGGSLRLEDSGRFYLTTPIGKIEMHMVAEGWRKLGMIAQLIANGSLTPYCAFLWDEPEANLNPRLIKLVAKIITDLSNTGIQVFIATHSLFLLRELHILQKLNEGTLENRYFGLKREEHNLSVNQGDSMDYVGELAALDEEVIQAERYIDLENGLVPRD